MLGGVEADETAAALQCEVTGIAGFCQRLQNIVPLEIAQIGGQMLVDQTVVVLNMELNGGYVAFEKLSAGYSVSVCVTCVVAPTEEWRVNFAHK